MSERKRPFRRVGAALIVAPVCLFFAGAVLRYGWMQAVILFAATGCVLGGLYLLVKD